MTNPASPWESPCPVPSIASSSAATPRASKEAWQFWLEHQKRLVNENRLSLADPKARKYLATQMEEHFFGAGADAVQGYVPPG